MARRVERVEHECGPECRYRGLYEGSQRSLADLASRQADALGRISRLRNQIIQGLKRIMPVEFTDAERTLGRRLSEVDDELLGAYLESFLLLSAGKTRSDAGMLARLRAALEARGVDVYGAHNLSEIVAVLERSGVDPLQTIFADAPDTPPQNRTATAQPPVSSDGVRIDAVERETPVSPTSAWPPTGDGAAGDANSAGAPLRRLLPRAEVARTPERDVVDAGATTPVATVTPAPSGSGSLDDLFDGDFIAPANSSNTQTRANQSGPQPPSEEAPDFDFGDVPIMPPEADDAGTAEHEHDTVVETGPEAQVAPPEVPPVAPEASAEPAVAKRTSGRGARPGSEVLRGPWVDNEHNDGPTTGAEVTQRAVNITGGVRPALLPTTSRTRQRKAKTPSRATATPADGLDVPVEQVEISGDLDDAMRERLMSSICLPRPVFSADLVDLVKSAEVVAEWENELAENGRDLSVLFVLPKTRHKFRGTLIFPREWPSTAPAAVRNSLWARVADKYRGAKVYELGVLLHRFNEEVISSELGNHVVTLRLSRPQGLVGLVVVLTTSLGEGEGTRAELIAALETLQRERLVQIAVLSTNAEVVDTLAEVVAEEAERREWAPAMPVTLSRSWEYANGTGVSLPLLGA